MDQSEVKACLRALLSSSAFSYNLKALLQDFRNTTGFDLPLFGFKNPVELLSTLTDTVQLFGDFYNPVVALVESGKSSHIASLVDRQRNKKINISNSCGKCLPPRLMMTFTQDPANNSRNYFPAEGNYISNTQNNIQKKTDCRQRGSISMNFGNNNQFRKNNLNAPNTSKNYHGNESSPRRSINARKDLQNQNQASEKIPEFNLEIENVSKNLPNEFPEFLDPPPKSKQSDNVFSVSKAPRNNSQETEKTDSCYFEDFSDIDSCLSGENSKTPPLQTDSYINNGMKSKLKQLIKKFPNGLWCCELPGSFFKEFNDVLDYREFGCTSLIEMLSELPDVFRCIRPGNEDWILFDASAPPCEEEKKLIKLQENRSIASDVANNLQKLLLDHSQNSSSKGIELNEIPYLYKMMFDTPLDFQSMGFSNVKSLLETYDGSLLNICKIDKKVMVLPIVKKNTQPLAWKEALPPITKDNDIFKEIFPNDVVGPDGNYSVLDLSLHIAVGQRIEISVAEVWSPGEFCVQLNKFRNRWNRFATELQNFYNTHLNKYKMPDATIVPHQLCVGLYSEDPENPDEWNRAKVLKVINERIVMVEFVDFGTVARVKKTQLRFLHRSFQSLPVQAFAAELYNLAPKDGDLWSMKASKKFLELSRVSYLEAELMDIDFKKPLLKVVLYDPSHNPHLNINKELISDNLAKVKNTGEELYSLENQKTVTSENGINGKTFNVVSDEFSDASDLECDNYTALFHFKMKSCKNGDDRSSSKTVNKERKKRIVNEFEEMPDWDKSVGQPETEETVITEKSGEPGLFDVREDIVPPKSSSSSDEISSVKFEEILPEVTTKRVPPGLERMVELNRCRMLPIEQPDDIKKKINILTMELLTTNPSIKQVALQDPTMALKIASEMAEVYIRWMCYDINPFGVNHLPGTVMSEPSFLVPVPMSFPEVFSTGGVCDSSANFEILTKKATSATTTINELESKADDVQISFNNHNSKTFKHVRIETVGGKNIHVTNLNGQVYFFAEELIRTFSTFSNRDVADRVLHLKKVVVEYKILNKSNSEKILTEIKSFDIPGVFKKKSKKWNVYMIQANTVIKFLKGLGCDTKSFESDITRFERAEG